MTGSITASAEEMRNEENTSILEDEVKRIKDDFSADYELWYERFEDYILVYGKEV